MMRNRPTLTSTEVQAMASACKAEATRNGWNVSFAIVDEGGFLLYFERMDDARHPLTAEVAIEKARTAALLRRPTKVWEDGVKDRLGLLRFPHLMPLQGGMPITVNGECVGAIGVSGVHSSEDEKIATAGVAALPAG